MKVFNVGSTNKVKRIVAANAGATLAATDSGTEYISDNASSRTFTLPSSAAGNVGVYYVIYKTGVGSITITPASGSSSTFYYHGTLMIEIELMATDKWIIRLTA